MCIRDSAKKQARTASYRLFKARQVAIWVVTNLVVAYGLIFMLNSKGEERDRIIRAFSYLFSSILVFKSVSATLFKLKECIYLCCKCFRRKDSQRKQNGESSPNRGQSNNYSALHSSARSP
eukprot:TRINITY_DN4605_c0_g2_i1.p1 TRINITY_DN4605_c0_g2~~TRINITY_DN4605_c0_g2_i1.p1  ORF type:complete len:140 (+),score=14.93 TRINITY_DN4605_c0_g2_i1:60-422(+)